MQITRRRLLSLAVVVALAALVAALASGGDSDVVVDPEPVRGDSVAQATALLEGRSFTTYASGSVTDASGDTTAYLCSGGRFTYVSNFVSTYVEGADSSSYDHPYGESRTEGTWQVTSATFGPGGQSGSAVVSYAANDGTGGQVQIEVGPNGATVNGQPAEVGSAGC